MTETETYIGKQFQTLTGVASCNLSVQVRSNERIYVSLPVGQFFLFEIGSDDCEYRFELWIDGRDTGIYVCSPFLPVHD